MVSCNQEPTEPENKQTVPHHEMFTMKNGSSVLVVGTGTIGEPLIGLIADYKSYLGVDTLYFNKRTARVVDRPLVKDLQRRGAVLVTAPEDMQSFRDIGLDPLCSFEEALIEADVVIDCTPTGTGQQNKERLYSPNLDNTLGFIAQGSEASFGTIYVQGINDHIMEDPKTRFVQVASCNTHNMAALIKCLAFKGEEPSLKTARFVLMRRSNDVSQVKNFVPAPKVSAYVHPHFGTHHATDVNRLYKTNGHDLDVFSSAVSIPTQYMHAMQFNLSLTENTSNEEVKQKLIDDPHFAVTYKMAQNLVFSFGRDHGFYGRILNQGVAILPSIHVRHETEVYGYAFTPQDGNALLSSVRAMCAFLARGRGESPPDILRVFSRYLYGEV